MSTVLIADDDPDILALVTFKVKQAGYHLVTATDGAAALAAARETTPDLVVLDVSMPRMSGLEVCRELRKDTATAKVPVLLLTARAQEADIEAGFDVGADDYVVKPFSPRELVARIAAILGPA
ncbi:MULTISPECIES: response regulator transcription factor [Cryptosporangium]|uniref:Response regulator with CheY-like receiver domain and winged-helix DNA-binding domain n=1 Tax=Cryptosporangium arvum DSM 44712 TaxID=927661 RepID=A0A010ZUQ7_9ACTN|nr:response regulator [Cryptosporangium arvum]EXG80942.1 response regulator with CheY-like receiver domain and winged-helix DNA-binding domain [Cryptosporangium arvum DSM 44712]